MSVPTGVWGVVHLPAMPGDPGCAETSAHLGFAAVREHALQDARALVEGGVDGLVVENFGSTPFPKGTEGSRLPPHQIAAMALVIDRLQDELDIPIGVNCLRNDAMAALGVAAATGAAWVRVNVHVGAYVTDQGLVEGEAAVSLRYRRSIGAENVAIAADILVKHAHPLAPLSPAAAARDAFDRGLADAVVVTGDATGAPVSLPLLAQVREAAGERVVLVGSGLTPDNALELARLADGAIVGTYFKRDGVVRAPVEVGRVRGLCDLLRGHFRGPERS